MILLYFWLLLIIGFDLMAAKSNSIRQTYSLNMEDLNRFYMQTGLAVLLKSKAKKELNRLPKIESLLFDQCSSEASKISDLAKCVLRLIRERRKLNTFLNEKLENSIPLNSSSLTNNQTNKTIPIIKISPISNQKLKISRIKDDKGMYKWWMHSKLNRRYDNLKVRYLNFVENETKNGNNFMEKKRIKREIKGPNVSSPKKCTKTMKNIENLRRIQEYLKTANECIQYLKSVGQKNADFLLSQFKIPVSYDNKHLTRELAIDQLQSFVNELETKELSFLSPKIMNILPSRSENPNLFSPTLLSFQNEGVMPLPRIFSLISTDQCELLDWINLLIHMTGASHRLEQILDKFGPDLEVFSEKIHPKVQKLKEMEASWAQVESKLTNEQRMEIEKHGYAPMTEEQLELVYKNKGEDEDVNEFLKRLKEDKNDEFLEELIEELASHSSNNQINDSRRHKRTTSVFAPSTFTGSIAQGVFLNNNILSPNAFVLQVLRPRALSVSF